MKSFRRLVDVAITGFLQQKQLDTTKSVLFTHPPILATPFQRLAPNLLAKFFFFGMKRMETSWKKSGENNFAPENLVARWWGTFLLGKHIIGSATYKTVNQLMRSWSRSQCDNEPSKTFKIGNVSYCKVQSMVVVRRFASIHIQRMKYFCLVLVSLCFWTKKIATPRCTLLGSPTHRVHGSRMTGQDLFRGRKGPKSWQKQNK